MKKPFAAGEGPQMNARTGSRRLRLLATALAAGLAAAPALAQDRGVAALLDQANYWKLQNRPDQVVRILDRVLQVDARNTDALSGLAEAHAQLGNAAQAQDALARLRQAAPADPRTQAADVAVRTSTVDAAALAQARQLAQAGRGAEAVQRYRALFGNGPVPDSFALEYYTTLAGTEGGWVDARDGLGTLASRNPGNTAVQLAYAQVLTYREDTRLEGIEILRRLSGQPATQQSASAAWRQTLSWLGTGRETVPTYEAYLQQFPNDADIARRLEEARNPAANAQDPGGEDRFQAWDNLQRGNVREAEARFQAALDLNPNDAEALGGMGLIRLRQNRVAEGRRMLQDAIAADPIRAADWQRALDSIGTGGGGRGVAGRGGGAPAVQGPAQTPDIQRARILVEAGDAAGARPVLARIVARNGGDRPDAEALLGDLALREGNAQEAEARFRAALARRGNFGAALSGLANALQAQGRFDEAEAIFRRLGTSQPPQVQAEALRAEALRTNDPAAAAALLRTAMQNDPQNPWLRVDYARLLARHGQGAEARRLVDSSVAGPSTPDALFAAAIFANEQQRPGDAVRLLDRIPSRARSADMNRFLASARIQAEVRDAGALATQGQRARARQQLQAIAARRDPTGEAAPAAIRALNAMNEPVAAQAAARAAAQAARGQPPVAQLGAAGALAEAGLDREAAQLASQINLSRLSPEQRRIADGLRVGLTIRASDQLNQRGDQATAFEVLSPALRENPQDPAANLALARLYQGARDNEQAGRIAEAVLSRNPRDTDARQAAVDAAIARRDWGRAEALLAEGRALMPNDARVPLLEARIARAFGDTRRAQSALEQAAAFRRQQLGVETRPGILGTGQSTVAPQNGAENPFRRVPLSGTPEGNPFAALAQAQTPAPQARGTQVAQVQLAPGSTGAAPPDPLLNEINRQLVEVREEAAPRFSPAFGLRTRGGDSGIDRLTETHAGVEGSTAMPGIGGRISARVAAVNLDVGEIAQNEQSARRFGAAATALPGGSGSSTAAQIRAATNTETSVAGVALGAAYTRGNLAVDIGSTPLGFPIENIVGGVEIAPEIADGVRLRLVGERRAITDSVLSWAGRYDPTTGRNWGGVTRLGGRAQLEFAAGISNFYVAAGYYRIEGDGVADNSRIEAGAGFQTPIWRGNGAELVSGLDIVYFAYDKNLSFQTLGHGGYFSPQSFIAASVPLDYRARTENLAWRVGASLGFATFTTDRTDVYPNDPNLQSQLVSLVNNSGGQQAFYPGEDETNLTAGLRGDIEYMLTPQLRIGAAARFDLAADWNELRALLYARYRFGE
jgi:tetratricopeptide (TPR) repeat protein